MHYPLKPVAIVIFKFHKVVQRHTQGVTENLFDMCTNFRQESD